MCKKKNTNQPNLISRHYLWHHDMHNLGKHPNENFFLLLVQHILSHVVVLTATLTAKVSSPQHWILSAVIKYSKWHTSFKTFPTDLWSWVCSDIWAHRTPDNNSGDICMDGHRGWLDAVCYLCCSCSCMGEQVPCMSSLFALWWCMLIKPQFSLYSNVIFCIFFVEIMGYHVGTENIYFAV